MIYIENVTHTNGSLGNTSFTVVKSSNILDYAKTLPFGWHFFRGASETPGNPTATASAMVIAYVITASQDISLLSYVHGNKAFLNTCSSGTWSGWQELAIKSDLDSKYQRFSVKYSSDLAEYESEYATNQLRILFGVIENASEPHPAMLSFDIEWIRFQVRIDRDSIKIRKRYGSNAFTEWKTIQP